MRVRRNKGVVTAALLILVLGFSIIMQARQHQSPSDEERAKAVNMIRLINTAELWYNFGTKTKNGAIASHGRYGTWQELTSSGMLNTVQGEVGFLKGLEISSEPEVMKGYQLSLLVSADGKSYLVALHDKREGDGLLSVFSDQNGLIFLGSPLQ